MERLLKQAPHMRSQYARLFAILLAVLTLIATTR